jgi:hypothetical protein
LVDKRKPWETKTFKGAVGFAVLIILDTLGIKIPYDQLYQLVTVWTGYSLADRIRK